MRHEIIALSEGSIPLTVVGGGLQMEFLAGKQVMVGLPPVPLSPSLVQRLVAEASTMPQIRALYLAHISVGQHSGIAIGVDGDFSKQEEASVFERLGKSIQPLLAQGEGIDFLVTRGSVGESVRKHGQQIFPTNS